MPALTRPFLLICIAVLLPLAVHAQTIAVSVTQRDMDGVPVLAVMPEDAHADLVVLYLHGGGYTWGAFTMPDSPYPTYLHHFATSTRLHTLGVDYRLAPTHPYPAALDDALTVYHALLAEGIAPQHIIVAGDSAGGGLALALMIALRDAGDPLPGGAALLAPWVDLTLNDPSCAELESVDPILTMAGLSASANAYAAGESLESPLISPLYADLRGLPPMLIQVGNHDMLFNDAVRLDYEARWVGVDARLHVWRGQCHAWPIFDLASVEGRAALEEIATFILSLD